MNTRTIYLINLLFLFILPIYNATSQPITIDANMLYGKVHFTVGQKNYPENNGATICPEKFHSLGRTYKICYFRYISTVFSIETVTTTDIEDKVYFNNHSVSFDEDGFRPVGDSEITFLYYDGHIPRIKINYYEFQIQSTTDNSGYFHKNQVGVIDDYDLDVLDIDGYIILPNATDIMHNINEIICVQNYVGRSITDDRPKKVGSLLRVPQFFIDTNQEYYWELKNANGLVATIEKKEYLSEEEYANFHQIRVVSESFASKFHIHEDGGVSYALNEKLK
ncbi:hypothetical protein [Flammeovirga aprica]|uniref:WG repeat-containing protein n=1 Tax=Flammeovirga aprica JL-4 TaxID=694437 RepID=A0A7X9P2P3_9BACT|nr:hypothetical protein [Flammeovirga aprica]NME68454.1 hypothetical protein [Flammeovirga aprica JL-4]